MSSVKKIGIVIFLIIMIVSECAFMGIFAVDFGASKHSVKSAIAESGIIVEMSLDAIKDKELNSADNSEEFQAVMRSKAVNKYFTNYMSSGIKNIAYGKKSENIAKDELVKAFKKGVDQVNRGDQYKIDANLEEQFVRDLKKITPQLTRDCDEAMIEYQTATIARTTGDPQDIKEGEIALNNMMAPLFRVLLLAIIIGSMIFILLLAMKKGKSAITRGGAVVLFGSIISTALYAAVAYISSTREPIDAIATFSNCLIADGALITAICGGIACVFIFIVLLAMKMKARRRAKEKAAKQAAKENTMEIPASEMQTALEDAGIGSLAAPETTSDEPVAVEVSEAPIEAVGPADADGFVEVAMAPAPETPVEAVPETAAPVLEIEPTPVPEDNKIGGKLKGLFGKKK